MNLLIIRHGIAEDKLEFSRLRQSDALRPLTPEGIRKMKKNALGLKVIVPGLDWIAASPFARALATAKIVAARYRLTPLVLPALAADREPKEILTWLAKKPANSTAALVGHEPYLSQLASRLLFKSDRSVLELRKGGACMISFDGPAREGEGILSWLLKPSQLRRIKD